MRVCVTTVVVGYRTTRAPPSAPVVTPLSAAAIPGTTRTTVMVRVPALTRVVRTATPTTQPVVTGIAPVVVLTPIRVAPRSAWVTLV